LKSDIKKNDIVVWGITSKNRFTWFDGVKISHINSTHYTEHPEFDKVVPLPLLDSSQRTYEAISAVQQVNNFCDKVGAHLIFANIHSDIDLLADFAKYKGFVMINIPKNLDDPNIFLDLGADQMHPGPKTHQYYAEMILKKINSLNIGT
jgi:hypothetical protein